ncbi:O-antigen ligase family protein [bacterium]|nr:O-antigen ligase family protein [bacterium]
MVIFSIEIVRRVISGESLLIDRKFIFLLLGYFWACLLSLNRAQSVFSSFFTTLIYFSRTLIIFVFAWVIETKEDLKKIATAFIVLGCITSISVFYELLTAGTQGYFRSSGIFFSGSINLMSHILSSVFPLLVIFILIEKLKFYRIFYIILLFFLFFAILGSQSRSAWAITVIALIPFLFIKYSRKQILKFSPFLVVLAILAFIYNPQKEYISIRYSEVLEKTLETGSRVNRIEVAWQMFRQSPITGIGIDNYDRLIGNYSNYSMIGHTHNLFFLVLAETGILGVIFFWSLNGYTLYLLFRSYKTLLKSGNQEEQQYGLLILGFFLMYVCFILSAMFHGFNPFHVTQTIFIGIALSTYKITSESFFIKNH